VRRADFHRMRARMVALVRLDADAARIHDQLSVRKARKAGNMRVAA
jgi:hypothetical protein